MVERSIDRLRAAGAAPHLSITVTGRNVDGIAAVVRFALERDLTFSFNFFRDNACSAGVAGLRFEEQAMIDGVRAACEADAATYGLPGNEEFIQFLFTLGLRCVPDQAKPAWSIFEAAARTRFL